MSETKNYEVTKAGKLVATGGSVTVSANDYMEWATATTDTPPNLAMKHPLPRKEIVPFYLDATERLFLFAAGNISARAAVTAELPAAGEL